MRKFYAKLWLEFAKEDLESSRVLWERGLIRTATYHLQQAAEKSLKSLLVLQGVEVPKTHDIDKIIKSLSDFYVIPKDIQDAVNLTEYTFTTRYPDDYVPVSLEEYEEAYEIAIKVYEWARYNQPIPSSLNLSFKSASTKASIISSRYPSITS